MNTLKVFLSAVIASVCLSCYNNNESDAEKELDRNPGVATNDSITKSLTSPVDTGSVSSITSTHDRITK